MKLLLLCTLFVFYAHVAADEQDKLNREVDKLVNKRHIQLPFAPDDVFPHQMVENYGLDLIITNSTKIRLKCRRRGNAKRLGDGLVQFKVYVEPLKFGYHYHAKNYGLQMIGTVTGIIKDVEYVGVYDKNKKKHERVDLTLINKGEIELKFKHGDFIADKFLEELKAAILTGVRFAVIKEHLVL